MTIGLRRAVLFSSDILAMVFAASITYAVTIGSWETYPVDDYFKLIFVQLILTSVALLYFSHKGHYTWRNPWWQQVRQTIRTCFIFVLISLLINLVTLSNVTGITWVMIYWGMAATWLLSFRWVGRNILKNLNHWDIPTILIGGYLNINETLYALRSEPYLSYDIQKIILTNYTAERAEQLQLAHGAQEPLNICETTEGGIPEHSMVVLCPDEFSDVFIKETMDKIRQSGARFAIVPPTNGFSLYGLQTQFFFGHKIVLLENRITLQTNLGKFLKFLTDKVGALLAIILLSPLFLILALRVRKDGGPAFYAQVRIGKGGKPFKCWKFRSMIINADELLDQYLSENPAAKEEYERDFKLKDDPRITPVGHLLRKSSLDEIPQFFNVLKGDMSLVGPRPIIDKEMPYYEDKLSYYLSVKPGVTGLWQVSGRNDISYEQRVVLDVWYVENWSIWNDIVIFLKTIYVVGLRKGAY